MNKYEVRLIVEGRSTTVTITASSAGQAASLAKAQYAGSNVRVLETNRV
jgi:hypothetical protein